MKEEIGSVITQRSRDCLGCRLVSGGGLLGVGVYISYQSKRANNLTFKIIMNTIALGIVFSSVYTDIFIGSKSVYYQITQALKYKKSSFISRKVIL